MQTIIFIVHTTAAITSTVLLLCCVYGTIRYSQSKSKSMFIRQLSLKRQHNLETGGASAGETRL